MTWGLCIALMIIAFVGGFTVGRRRRIKVIPTSKTEAEVNDLVKENEALLVKIAEVTKRKNQ